MSVTVEPIKTELLKSDIRLYDIANLVAPFNDSLNGKTAFVTRLPILGSREYELFFLGDDYVPPRIIRFRKDDPTTDVDDIIVSIENRNNYDTIVETLNLEKDTILAGYLRENPSIRHPLRVVRVADTDIYVSRLDDPTEIVFRIPLEEGISPSSPYAFLRPAILEDDGPDVLPEEEMKKMEEKDEFVRRMSAVPGVKVIFTDMPRVIERQETIRPGGSRDVERIAGQVVSAISSLDTRGLLDHAADGSKIRDIILQNTIGKGYDGREVIYTDEQPIMIRGKTNYEIPKWIIPVSLLETDNADNAISIPSIDENGAYRFIKSMPDIETENRRQPYVSYYKTIANALFLPTIFVDPTDDNENLLKMTAPTMVMFPRQKMLTPLQSRNKNKKQIKGEDDAEKEKGEESEIYGDFIRVLLPEQRNTTVLREATIITSKTAVTVPNQDYIPEEAPLYLKLKKEQPWKLSSKPKYTNAPMVTVYNPLILAKKTTLLPDGIIKDVKSTLSFLSPTLPKLLQYMPPIKQFSLREIGKVGAPYGWWESDKMSDKERIIASLFLLKTNQLIKDRMEMMSTDPGFKFPSPDSLFKNVEGLKKLYPNTLGVIGVREALDRIMTTQNDYGKLLLLAKGMNEHYETYRLIESIIRESDGRRLEVKRQMAMIQEQLRDIEGQLHTLPAIAKHYGSRKEVELAKGTIPLWDESLDDDKMRFLYTGGERLQKIIGNVLADLQGKGALDIRSIIEEPTDDTVCNTEETLGKKIPADVLIDAVRDDLIKYNSTVNERNKIPESQFDSIVRRVILGGRPVENGDVALITRHLRTAAYKWNAELKQWVQIKENDGIFQFGDIDPSKKSEKARNIFKRTLLLNKEYRALSKTKDDLELLESRPDLRMDADSYRNVIESLLEDANNLSENRLRYIGGNRILDEYPFVHDRIPSLVPRFAAAMDIIRKTEEALDEEDKGKRVATRQDFREALVKDQLVIDTELELFNAGYTEYISKQEAIKEIGMDTPDIGIMSSQAIIPLSVDDPKIADIQGRQGVASYITGVKGADNQGRRLFLGAIGFMETLLKTQLTYEEIIGCYTDYSSIIPKGSTTGDIILRGISLYCLMIMTRIDGEVRLPKTEEVTPPIPNKFLPSYASAPLLGDETVKSAKFLNYVIEVLQKAVYKSIKEKTYTTVYTIILNNLVKTGLLKKTKTGDDGSGKEKDGIVILIETVKKGYSTSPFGTYRVFQADSVVFKTKKDIVSNAALRVVGQWERLPITHMPHPKSLIMRKGMDVLNEQPILFRDSYGTPFPQNAAIISPVVEPELPKVLFDLKHASAERLAEVMYKKDPLAAEKMKPLQTTVLLTPTPDFISVKRPRIEGKKLVGPEIPKMEKIKLTEPLRMPPTELGDDRITEEQLKTIFNDVIKQATYYVPMTIEETNVVTTFVNIVKVVEDYHGTLRGALVSFHDALIMALEQQRRRVYSISEPIPIEAILYKKEYIDYKFGTEKIPIYTARRLVKRVMKDVQPMKIEYSITDYPAKGGSLNTVLTGKTSYFQNVINLRSKLDEYGLRTIEKVEGMINFVREIQNEIREMPPRISVEYAISVIGKIIGKYSLEKDDNIFSAVVYYLAILDDAKEIVYNVRKTSTEYTDVNDALIDEELNHDRERERQRFIYQLEGLDSERRKLARSSRALGLDLAGKVAKDPRKFNAEYYEQQLEMVAEQQIEQQYAPEVTMAEGERSTIYGDQVDVLDERDAIREAPTEVDQIEDLDYDA